jgi:hypothetical protein
MKMNKVKIINKRKSRFLLEKKIKSLRYNKFLRFNLRPY